MKFKSSILSVLLSSLFIQETFAYCPPQYQETWVLPMFTNSTLVMNSALATVDAQLTALMKLNDQRVLSALAVLTKQKALSGSIVADTERKATQQVANGLRVLASFKYMRVARLDYGPEFGQGYNPCKISNERVELSTQNAKVMDRVNTIVKNTYAAPGKYAGNLSESKQQLLRDISNYCTPDHVDSGLCETVGKNPGLALNASIMFTTDGVGNEYDTARKTFINTIVGIPDPAIPRTEAKSPEAQEYALQKQEKDALISPAITTLANLQSNYSSINNNKPIMAQYKNQAKRYFGDSQENMKWNKVLTAQTERGLLVEQLKIKALSLSLQAKQYKEYELLETQIAALLAQEIRKNELLTRTVKGNSARSVEDNIAQSIK
jgi:hypothetical protein